MACPKLLAKMSHDGRAAPCGLDAPVWPPCSQAGAVPQSPSQRQCKHSSNKEIQVFRQCEAFPALHCSTESAPWAPAKLRRAAGKANGLFLRLSKRTETYLVVNSY